jgi:hypothetical protein
LRATKKAQKVTDAREFRKFVGRLRERRRKEGRAKQVSYGVARDFAVIVTEELGKNPQEEIVGPEEMRMVKRELRHCIKQTPLDLESCRR